MAFEEEKHTKRDDAGIPNTQIETMFMRVCNDEEMAEYMKFIETGYISLATAYASNKVSRVFYMLVDQFEGYGLTLDELKERKERGKKKKK